MLENKRVSIARFREHLQSEIITPTQFYREIYDIFQIPRRKVQFDAVYLTYPVTSGGILFDDKKSTFSPKKLKQDWMKILNGQTIEIICEGLMEELEGRFAPDALPWELISPAHINFIPGWGEFEYMQFWAYFIPGIHPDKADKFAATALRELVENRRIDLDLFNLHATDGATKAKKYIEYKKLIQTFFQFQSDEQFEHENKPVSLILAMPNHHTSVGSNAEKHLGLESHVPVQELWFNPNIQSGYGEGHLKFRALFNRAMQTAADDPENTIILSTGLFGAVDNAAIGTNLFVFNEYKMDKLTSIPFWE